jgi:hypothetical protein
MTADPSRVVVSWQLDIVRGRWFAVVFFAGMGVFLGAALVLVGPTGEIKYYFVVPEDGHAPGKKSRTRSASFNEKKRETPMFLSPDGRRILAVRPSNSRDVPLVLRQDGYPFALSETARDALTAAVARRRDRTASK